MKKLAITTLYIILPFVLQAQLTGDVSYVSDGDTFKMVGLNGEKFTVRVADIDCPESAQPYGLEAKSFTLKLLLNKRVSVQVKTVDLYGRLVASVRYEDKDLAELLLINGLAWHYKQYSKSKYLAQLEGDARHRKIGLWIDDSPTAPWEYRRGKKF